jgi:hypothetical protein
MLWSCEVLLNFASVAATEIAAKAPTELPSNLGWFMLAVGIAVAGCILLAIAAELSGGGE